MKRLPNYTFILVLLFLTINVGCDTASNTENESDDHAAHGTHDNHSSEGTESKKSLPQESHAQIGELHATIAYYSPAVRDRVIWGGLVPYNEVWVTGAHSATRLNISREIAIGDVIVPAGDYAIFTIPGKEKWSFILNKNWEQHLTDDYDSDDDVVRVEVEPTALEKQQERLLYDIVEVSERSGTIEISWDTLMIAIPFKVN